jgi:hypothetical protein
MGKRIYSNAVSTPTVAEDSIPLIEHPATREQLTESIKILADAESMPETEQRTTKPRKRRAKNVEPAAQEPPPAPVETTPATALQDAAAANVGEGNANPTDPPLPAGTETTTDTQADPKQAAVTELVRKYGSKDLRAWGGFHSALKEFGLEPKDISDERLSVASLTLHQADEKMRDGIHQFNGTSETTPSPASHEEVEMSEKKKKSIKLHDPATEPAEAPKAKSKAKKAAKPAAKTEGKMSLKDAAIEVLRQAGQPMTPKELVAAAVEKELWTPGEGKTPEATLAAAIYVEINKKGSEARFVKADKGKFALRE